MTRSIRDTLEEARKDGEVVRIINHGGSQPGTVRSISIISINDIDVRARDLATGVAKIFKLRKIELAEASSCAPEYDSAQPPAAELAGSIQEVLAGKVEYLQSIGWHVKVDEDAISLHRFFKNGKPRKTPDIELIYNEYTFDAFVDTDGKFKQEKRKSRRPYRLGSRNLVTAKTFSKLSSAVTGFLTEAQVLAPTALSN